MSSTSDSAQTNDTIMKAMTNLAKHHYVSANCMTDQVAGLKALLSLPMYSTLHFLLNMCIDLYGNRSSPEAFKNVNIYLDDFYNKANNDPLVVNKWFAVQVIRVFLLSLK